MREIKFKFWDAKQNEFNKFLNTKTIFEIGAGYYLSNSLHLIPMQYTGLKDKNGVEIYEGDICCDYFDNAIGVIKFINGCFVYEALYDDMFDNIAEDSKRFRVPIMKRVVRENQYVEVIGNIYENKELLNA